MNDYVRIYTDAIYSLAKEEDMLGQFLNDMRAVCDILNEYPEYTSLADAPTIETGERIELLDKAFNGQISIYVLNFIKVLAEKRRMHIFEQCFDAFSARYNEEYNIVHVQAVTASALSEKLTDSLKEKLTATLGKTVILTNTVDPACMGGVILRYENKQLDGSVRARLETLRNQLTSAII